MLSVADLISISTYLARGVFGKTTYIRGGQGYWYSVDNAWGFDCIGLVKAIVWGWKADKTAANGGAVYGSNNMGDWTELEILQNACSGYSSTFNSITLGAYLCKINEWGEEGGHGGIYIGTRTYSDGKNYNYVECTGREAGQHAGNSGVFFGWVDNNGVCYDYEGGPALGYKWYHWGTLDKCINYNIASTTSACDFMSNYEVENYNLTLGTGADAGARAGANAAWDSLTDEQKAIIRYSQYPEEGNKILVGYTPTWSEKTITTTRTGDWLESAEGQATDRIKSTNLLSTTSLVESPFIILKIGNYTFGSFTKSGNINTELHMTFPNYITGAEVTKVNGTVNTYVINMTYQISPGSNPNLLDEIFSSVGYGMVYISYGDWMCPAFIYREEEALITKLSSKVDFSNQKIDYTLYCTSNSIQLASTTHNFAAKRAKPSDIIYQLLNNNTFNLSQIFTAMQNETVVRTNGWIASDDMVVDIEAKNNISVLDYINYLVTCMVSTVDNSGGQGILRNSSYYLTIHDEQYKTIKGSYFTITKVTSNSNTLSSYDTYEVDVGFPTDNNVVSFDITDDNSWALLYNYSVGSDIQEYTYSIDNAGNVVSKFSPSIVTSANKYTATASQLDWWTKMTKFPISATLVIKGLMRSAMLMTYVRVNALFYGQRHSSSGLYIITKQVDKIRGEGFRTELTLQKIGGDDDVINRVTKTVTTTAPIITLSGEGTKTVNIYDELGISYTDDEINASNAAWAEAAKNAISNSGNTQTQGTVLTKNQCNNTFETMETPTYNQVKNAASSILGWSEEAFTQLLGWVQNEGYWPADPYLSYLCGCVWINNVESGLYSKTGWALQNINSGSGWEWSYTQDKLYSLAKLADEGALKSTYLAIKNLKTGIHNCYGPGLDADPSGYVYFYKSDVYADGYQICVW